MSSIKNRIKEALAQRPDADGKIRVSPLDLTAVIQENETWAQYTGRRAAEKAIAAKTDEEKSASMLEI